MALLGLLCPLLFMTPFFPPPAVPKPILTQGEGGAPLPVSFNQSFPQQMKVLQEGLQVPGLGNGRQWQHCGGLLPW